VSACLSHSHIHILPSRSPVGQCVVHAPQAGVALVIQAAVGQPTVPQEAPHVNVAPVQDGVDAHERGPAC
jgi:hypothetical protein